MVWIILTVILYVFGAINTFALFDETTKQSTFNKVWFSVFWPAVSMLTLINYIIALVKKK